MRSEATELARTRQEVKRLARQLQESREWLQLIQWAANIGIFEWNIQTGAVICTRRAEELFGLAPGSFGGTFEDWKRLVHPDDFPEVYRQALESIERKTSVDVQFRIIWPDDGSIHWIYAKGHTFYDAQEKPLRMLGVNIDITERKKYEEELHRMEEKLRLFAESDVIGVIFSDIYGGISYANNAFLRIIGYSRREFLEKSIRWTEITPPEWLPVEQRLIEEGQQKGTPVVYEKQYVHKNGSRVDILIGHLLVGEQRDQAIAFVLDITERKRLERQKDEFIGVVSHELRTPVTSLKAFTQVLHKRFQKSGDQQSADLLAKMETQIDKLTKLIGDLIDVTKVEEGKLQLHETACDLSSLIDEVIEEVQRTTARHTIIKEGVCEQVVWGDRDRLGRVLTNLLSNAIKYSPYADTILVRVSSDSKRVIVAVQDFGMGIPQEKQAQIFQRFYRVEEKRLETISGLGLGLYISAEMVKRHGGDIWFESAPGLGSTFSFSIPLLKKSKRLLAGNEIIDGQENSDC